MIVGAHVHLWNRECSGYPWLSSDFDAIARTFEPRSWTELRSAGVDRAILVQTENSRPDTGLMLELAAAHDWIAGVVGWAPLDDPEAADVRGLVGVCDLVHSMRDPTGCSGGRCTSRCASSPRAASSSSFQTPTRAS